MRWVIGIAVALGLAGAAAYLSPYWVFDWWGREGLAGVESLRPGGDLVSGWLRGGMAAPFSLILWGLGVFTVLSVLNWLKDRLTRHD